jgi:hypothetical protein
MTADITIRDYSVTGNDPFASERAALQGYWVSVDDSRYQVLIHGGTFEEFYDTVPTSMSVMGWQNACDGSPGYGPAFVLRDISTGDSERCMFVMNAPPGRMRLAPAGVMNDLEFRRQN